MKPYLMLDKRVASISEDGKLDKGTKQLFKGREGLKGFRRPNGSIG